MAARARRDSATQGEVDQAFKAVHKDLNTNLVDIARRADVPAKKPSRF
jgi:hypothetical protein